MKVRVALWTLVAAVVTAAMLGSTRVDAASESAGSRVDGGPVGPVAGTLRTIAGPIDAGSGGIVVDAQGRVYTADFGSRLGGGGTPGERIHRVDPGTGLVSVFAEGFEGASGNAMGSDGSLYQSNIRGNTISRVSPDGEVTAFASGLVNPVGIAVGPGDTLFVANCGNNTIARVDPSGSVTPYAESALLACPNGLVRTPSGDLYSANFYNGNVVRITPDGEASIFATVPGNNNGHITYGNGMLYVVARSAHQLYSLSLDGELTLIAGSGARGRDDGPALEGTLSLPNDLGLSPDGRMLYFNDVAAEAGAPTNLSPVYVRVLELDGPAGP